MSDARRHVPSLDALLRSKPGRRAAATFGRPLVKQAISAALSEVRARASRGMPPPDDDEILAAALAEVSRTVSGLSRVINATGVILHTNLGRAPLPPRAVEAVVLAAGGYTDLELDRTTGKRGSRTWRAEALLTALTGAEAALVVNNCAAALLLALASLARRKEVLVSRGELIEIGGEFRLPDILAASGAKLIEVGTTNRTRIGDYRSALSERTGAILRVHPSNYRVVGFTSSAATTDLAVLAGKHGLPFLFDVGSGLLATGHGIADDEPTVTGALRDGAQLVTFSGDKLLGGPQAGCVVGDADLIARLRRHPIARAVRVDKLQLAALESVLSAIAAGRTDDLPVQAMLREPAASIAKRAHRLAEAVGGDLEHAHVERCTSVVGGGSMPGASLPSWAVGVRVPDPPAFAGRLRIGPPPVCCRVEDDRVMFDLRTVFPGQVDDLARAILYALEGDDLDEDEDLGG
ncbi:MAG: L-seryl-tRNA(Sec) selenium transferase [Actinomycetota bacterium]